MLNGSCLIVAGNQMDQGAAHVQRKGIKLQNFPQKSFGLSKKKKTTNQPNKQPHLCICLFIGINKNGCCLNSYFFLETKEKNNNSICWISCVISPILVSRSVSRVTSTATWGLYPQCFTHTLGRSVFGSLSTFSIAVRVSKPPTTLKEERHVIQLSQHTQNIPTLLPLIYLIYAHYSSRFLNHLVWGERSQQQCLEDLR